MEKENKNLSKFKFLEHMADIKFQAYGSTLKEVFENVVLAFSSYVSSEEKIESRKGKTIEVSGKDNKSLLYNFIDEIIFLLDSENFIVAKADILLRGNNLKAELYGDNAEKYNLKHVKATTCAEMHIKKIVNKWEIQVVLDV